MAEKKESYRVSCNKVNCKKSEMGMPQEGDAVIFDNKSKNHIIVTNSGTRGFVPEEIALGIGIEVYEGKPRNNSTSKETR